MRLLLAEDERELSRALTAILTHHNYSVDTVDNGEDALDYLIDGQYDGAVLDIMMPRRDGISVVRALRERGSTVPVLLLTARSQIEDRVAGLDSGADDYLTKPFSSAELLARIRAMTRRREGQASNLLQFGDLTLDRASCRLSGPCDSCSLAGKEYQMMELFLESPGCVISAERIFEKIWGYEAEAEINTVWVYLSNLRKKLASTGSRVGIRSRRNLGYVLEEDHG